MNVASHQLTPRARQERLIVEELPGEILVYDLDREKAHCLNITAALVWNHCDGRTTVADMALNLGRELKAPVDEQMIWLALSQLDEARLLRERLPRSAQIRKVSRREVMRRVGLAAAVSLPLVTSILAPVSSQAQSCFRGGNPCVSDSQCCSGRCIRQGNSFVCAG